MYLLTRYTTWMERANDRYTYNAAPHTLASNQLSLFIALAEKLISNLRMQIAK